MKQCKCYIDHGEEGDIEEIVQCPLCKAAPDLLEALEALNEQLLGANIPFSKELFDAKNNARQAIAKATEQGGHCASSSD